MKLVKSSVTLHHTSASHMIQDYLANQKDPGEGPLQTRQAAANQNETQQQYHMVMLRWE